MVKQRRRNPDSLLYVVRIDHKSTHGYQVRIPVEDRQESTFFADGKQGGKKKAKLAAIAFRDKKIKEMGLPTTNRRRIRRSDKRNKTGKVGVTIHWRTVGNYQYKYYVASWCPKPGQPPKRKAFYAHGLGDKKALELAIKFREEKEKDIVGLGAKKPKRK